MEAAVGVNRHKVITFLLGPDISAHFVHLLDQFPGQVHARAYFPRLELARFQASRFRSSIPPSYQSFAASGDVSS